MARMTHGVQYTARAVRERASAAVASLRLSRAAASWPRGRSREFWRWRERRPAREVKA